MNSDIAARIAALTRPTFEPAPKRRSRGDALIDELRFRLAMAEKEKSADLELQLVASVAGRDFFIRQLGIHHGDVVVLEAYHAGGRSITIAPLEQAAFTIYLLPKIQAEPTKFMGFSFLPDAPKG